MPFLNYTTEVSAERSVAEIQSKLAKAGAWSILHEYQRGTGELIGLSFQIDTQFGPMAFRLPANIDAVAKILIKHRTRSVTPRTVTVPRQPALHGASLKTGWKRNWH